MRFLIFFKTMPIDQVILKNVYISTKTLVILIYKLQSQRYNISLEK